MSVTSARYGIAIGLVVNAFLLLLKAGASGISDSLTIFSETLNSLSDFIGAIVVLIFVRWAHRTVDDDHPFGHGRAEPIAGLVLGLFSGILGIEVLRHAGMTLASGALPHHIGPWPAVVLLIAIVLKGGLAVYFGRLGGRLNSPAFRASALDSRNDVIVGSQALLGVLLAEAHLTIFDGISALLVGLYILYSAYHVATENIDYLMGKAPESKIHEEIRSAAHQVNQVKEVADIRAHYVGTLVHVELTARVWGGLSTSESHDVAEQVREAVEFLPSVSRAFVHIEPAQSPGEPASETEGAGDTPPRPRSIRSTPGGSAPLNLVSL